MATCAVIGVSAFATEATFTDAASATASFSSGTLDVVLGDATGNTGQGRPDPFALPLQVTGLFPDSPAVFAELRVINSGTLPLTVGSLDLAAETPSGQTRDGVTALGAAIRIRMASLTGAAGCSADAMTTGSLVTDPTGVSVPSTVNTDQMAVANIDAGDTWRLCIELSMPTGDPPAAAQGAAMQVEVTVHAEQR